MKRILLFFILIFLINCKVIDNKRVVSVAKPIEISLIDSLKSVLKVNVLDTFNYNDLYTDDFSKMTLVSNELLQKMGQEEYEENSVFILSFIPNENKYLTLILYQKNFEGQDYRADKILLVNIDSKGKVLDEIILATEDNRVITYEVNSYFKENGLLFLEERMGSESYFNPNRDTLFTSNYLFQLNAEKRIDTLSLKTTSEERLFLIDSSSSEITLRKAFKLMGCGFSVTLVAKDSLVAEKNIEFAINEMRRIEKLISSWDPNSQTSSINNNAGIKPVKVSMELFELIERSLFISKITDGAFDISYASMDKIWKFDGSMKEFPSKERINKSIKKVAFSNVILNKKNQTVFLKKEGMKIGFGAIGKGYAADKAKELLIKLNVQSGIINASGDINCWGKQPNGEDWKVAITNPLNRKNHFAMLPVKDQAVVTSGNYEKFIIFNGLKYSHIINPKTGVPAQGVLSVTVFAPKAELADALATSIFVMGKEIGLDFINQLPNIECIIMDDKGKLFYSTNIKIETND